MTARSKSWALVPLHAVVTIKTGPFGSALHKSDYVANGVPVINPMHIRRGVIQPGDSARVGEAKLRELAEFQLIRGDVILGRRGEMGRCAVVGKAEAGWLCGTGSLIMRPAVGLDPRYLQRFLSSPAVVARLEGDAVGSTMVNLNQGILKALEIPVPSLRLQQRIVDKLDAMLVRVDACRERLDSVPAILKRFRQAVLVAATSGTLTQGWRGGGKSTWEERRIDEVATVFLGRQRSPEHHSGPHMRKYVRAANVTWDGWDLSDVKEMNFAPQDFERFRLQQDDILLNEGSGSAEEVGKPAIWNGEIEDCCFQNTLICVRPRAIHARFLYLTLLHAARAKQFVDNTRGVNIYHIGKEKMAAHVIHVPSSAEQLEVVRRVESLFVLADAIEAKWQAARPQVERLTPALLARAFRGELVPQDPNDEPAAELLKRLAQSRADAPAKARKPRQRQPA